MPRILVVEDSATQAEELRFVLAGGGFDVEVAANGRVALELVASQPFDLVLSDILMPEISGYDLCRRLKTNPATRFLPVVLLTWLTDPLDVLRGLECGADNFLTKPCEPRYLLQRIQSVLANRTAGAPASGTPLAFRGQGITITSDKSQILDLLLAALEEFIRARQREQEALAAGEAMAEAGRRKDQFLATLAHELRNPLAPLLTNLHIARQSDDRRVLERALDSSERQVRHLSRLVDDLLDASRVTVGRLKLHAQRLDLARLVRQAADDHRLVLERSGLSLTIDAPSLPVWVNGDDTRLSQVVHNLLDNCIRFTDSGGAVTVSMKVEEGKVVAVVRDTGIGIDPSLLPQLFSVFSQAAQSIDRKRGGLGVGLALVKGIVELHGGGVSASSAGLGHGAEFSFWLPLEQEPAALAGSAAQSVPGETRPLSVVVIEDNQPAADSLCLFLKSFGHEVRVAYCGLEGVRLAAEVRPEAVISDIGLPGLDGYGVASALRGDPATADALMIAVSGYGQEEDIRRARAAGFDHYLVKPAPPEDLLELLRSSRGQAG